VPGWSDLAKAMRYILRHWDGLILYLDDGRLEMDTNVVERAIRPVTITRKNSLFAGSDAGARRWAIANTLIQSCKLNSIDPLAWLIDVLQRIVSGRTKNHKFAHTAAVELAPTVHHLRHVTVATTVYLYPLSSGQSLASVMPTRRLLSIFAHA
jgi:transposase IS66 family protein/transposase IS66-like protein